MAAFTSWDLREVLAMRASHSDLENSGRNEHVGGWIMILGIMIAAYLAVAV